ncbi:hypothetical protein O3M35_001158 [Rhynocoris fuscipes]|uniref:Lipase domain-containing protein n=1 Tax=Rhynocoris fuscipes TaxID=488301 RepID=A0AAW1DRA1_9HEMI
MKETLLKVCDCNIIIVDWSKYAVEPYYLEASQNTQPIGRTVGDFLLNIGTNLSSTELVAYSLGCHVAGKASSTIGSQIHRIIAFDPALPLFANSSPKYRLDATDAYIVEVVHTCAGILGFNEPIGLRDFWANGGDHPQPGCGQLSPLCSHRRSFQYYSEALLNEGRGFKTRRCDSYSDYKDSKCKGQPFLALANHNVNTNLKGNFYFMTNSESPFGKFN